METEDTITLAVQWLNLADGSLGHATYTRRVDPPCFVLWVPEAVPSSHPSVIRTSSWIAPKAEVHSQQRWFYMGQKGEVSVDQVHQDPPPPSWCSCGSCRPRKQFRFPRLLIRK